PGRDAGEHIARAIAHIDEMRDRVGAVVEAAGPRAVELHELVRGPRAGERPQDQRVDRREDGGVESDAECEREHGDTGEDGILAQQPAGVSQVEEQRAHTEASQCWVRSARTRYFSGGFTGSMLKRVYRARRSRLWRRRLG